MLGAMSAPALILDFDGTITEQDLLDAIATEFGDEDVFAELEVGLLDGGLPLHEVIRREFAPVKAPLHEVVGWVLANARTRPGFAELVREARERGYEVAIVSSGFKEFIGPVLEREGLGDLPVVASSADPDPAGWRITFPDEEICAVCGQACKRASVQALANGGTIVYVGDGYSDRCAAELADHVFARAGLARYLDAKGVPYEPFDDFHDIARTLP
jgi:2-hydroxy-3-keto-5-methylthiopentenyl-1-phosphate phosphatase